MNKLLSNETKNTATTTPDASAHFSGSKIHMEKNISILSDLMEYCIAHGAIDIHTSLHCENDCSVMTVTAHIPGMKRATLESLYEELSVHRQREVEQNYWELSAEHEGMKELCLVGMMTDKAQLDYEDDILKIRLWRSL